MSPYCDTCGAHVTTQYIRVFGRDGHLDACSNCTSKKEMFEGEAIPEVSDGE